MVPTRRLVALAFIASAIAFAAGYVTGIDQAWMLLDVVLVTMVGLEAFLGRKRSIEVERKAPQILSVGRANAITITLHNRSDRTLSGTIMDDPVEDATVDGLPGTFELAPHGSAVLRYEIVPTRRGKRELDGVTVRYGLPFGLLQRQERTHLPESFEVYPDVHAARALEMLRRQGREDARLGSLRVKGGDTEFERLRPYQVGDEIRHIDWRAAARRDDLVVRQYQAESDQNVVFAIDTGRGMRGESHGITSIDHALRAALLAADVALRAGDRAGFFTFDDRPRTWVRPTGGRSAGRKLARAAYALDAGLAATDYRAAMVFLKTQMKVRSLFVIFTNLLDPRGARELASAVKSLMPRHLPLCVMMHDEEVERLALAPVGGEDDIYVRAAAGESLAWRESVIRTLKNSGALVLSANAEEITPMLVKRYLEVKARRLL